jgi:hypothetical protein
MNSLFLETESRCSITGKRALKLSRTFLSSSWIIFLQISDTSVEPKARCFATGLFAILFLGNILLIGFLTIFFLQDS